MASVVVPSAPAAARPPREGAPDRAAVRLRALAELGAALSRPLDLEDVYRATHAAVAGALDVSGFIFALYQETTETVQVVYQVEEGHEMPGGSFPLGSGFTSQVIRNREPLLIRRWSQQGPRIQVLYSTETGRLRTPESGMTVPLLFDDHVVGVLSLQSFAPEAYDDDDLLLLRVIASQVAVAIAHLLRSERQDAQLWRQVRELETILASMADALLIVDRHGAVVRLNRAARDLLRLDQNSIVLGQPLDAARWGQWQAGARAVAEALRDGVSAVLRGESIRDAEVELRGEGRRVLGISSAPLLDGAGMVTGGVIVFRDVTGRREVERLKDEVLSIASHDLKTPVSVIKLQAQLSLRRLSAGLDGRDATDVMTRPLSMIHQQADRLVELLDLLLDLSRIEAGRLDLRRARTDLVALVRRLVAVVETLSDRHRFVVRAPAALEGLWDEQRLEQVLQNLLSNAIKYSPTGGMVEVSVAVEDGEARVRVRDEGAGLPPEEVERVFERFYRAEVTRRLEGSGLGLYICREIIATHGGRVWAESAGVGQGSTFCFSLPLGQPTPGGDA